MKNYLMMLLTGLATTLFFFPFFPTFLPSVNTKMMMAACGLGVLVYNISSKGGAELNKDFFVLSLSSLGISLASYASMVINCTPDDSYLSYFVSMWVWLGAAYFMVNMIKYTHGRANVELICRYLIVVGVCQCILAETMDHVPAVKNFIDSLLVGEGFMGKNEGRLYGLGCALDVAGSRFAVLLIMIVVLLVRQKDNENYTKNTCQLLLAYGIIAAIGNIIGRTTIVGVALSIVVFFLSLYKNETIGNVLKRRLLLSTAAFVLAFASIGTVLYNTNSKWRDSIEFGFEGFFSLARTGHWEVHSNDMLKGSFIFPENSKTWIIGDGYMAPTTNDPYYVGKTYESFYMGTDVGYSRFIFYFGLIGLSSFILFMLCATRICVVRFKEYQMLFVLILLVNLIVWMKVSSDVFLCLAPFLALTDSEDDEVSEYEMAQ